ncbi:MAG TPA: mandelate racemase/muconate lactonizing enzyme family protein [Rhizomicrobium sp.]|jgi:L-alanine-DL-glutamate epimerase-like enolase superfamily enzyme|nr:mandelate racemase/muconate lactonizing enzyme family protein [Rhizomicrobium sp.]
MSEKTTIRRARCFMVELVPETPRTDAIQAFVKQQTIFVEVEQTDGRTGLGYSYTIGTGGHAVLALLERDLLPVLAGLDARDVEAVWQKLFWHTHATAVGAITSLALAAVDLALWDLRCKRADEPLWKLAGGSRDAVPVYDTEGGWLHLDTDTLIAGALRAKAAGWSGVKIKVGKPDPHEDRTRLAALREAVGTGFNIMLDANQSLTAADAIRRARLLEPFDPYWLEEPLPAEDITGHVQLARATSIPIAVGESIYSPSHFREYLQHGGAGIVQPDVARIGGITPWLKTAHMAEAFNVKVAPHFLMEIHVSLSAAVPNAIYVEHIPQLRALTHTGLTIENGMALAPDAPGLGIDWNFDALKARAILP